MAQPNAGPGQCVPFERACYAASVDFLKVDCLRARRRIESAVRWFPNSTIGDYGQSQMLMRLTVPAAAFFGWIFAFASVFTWLVPTGLLNPNIRSDQHYHETVLEVEEDIAELILRNLNSRAREFNEEWNGAIPPGAAMSRTSVRDPALQIYTDTIEDTGLIYDVHVHYYGPSGTSKVFRGKCVAKLAITHRMGGQQFRELDFPRNSGMLDYVSHKFSCKFNPVMTSASSISISEPIGDPLRKRLEAITSPESGFPKGLFPRMLYFSAVNATSLGYGDIVPISDAARILVISESIGGLIIIGWLVWGLTNRPTSVSQKGVAKQICATTTEDELAA